ncbi:MAG TPA: AarF/UbiB family protein [Methylococcaceae bacterium]|jgi:ubiquinone biosynthesis protein|nr:AarF/UbiB family protein [Methylococcaceae bacterium]
MNISLLTRLDRNVHRVGDIIGVLAKYGLADWVKGLDVPWIQERIRSVDGQHIPDLKIEERVRLAFTELGTTFIKLGQMLSTRPDLVGPEMAGELAHLQTAVPADPPATVRATIKAEFGKPPGNLFAHFNEEPLASASIAQVHVARLHSGEHVVVKVQHAGIEDKIMPDLDILGGLAEWVEEHSSQLRPYQPEAVARQFRRTLLRELDFTFERRNLEEFAKNFAQDGTVHFPRAYAPFSTRRVLTMEKLDGILVTHPRALANSGVDLNEFARRGATMYLQMIFRDAFYHADPHPGNLMLLPGGVVGVLDCGMVGRVDEELAEGLDDLLMAVVNHNSVDLEETLLRVGSAPAATPRQLLRADLTDFIADYVSQSIQDMNMSGALNDLFGIIRRNNIILPPPLSMLLRTLVELEGTAQRLSPEFSLAEVIRPYYDTMVRKRFSVRRILGRLQHAYSDWERLAASLPRDLNDVLKRVRDSTFSVHLDLRRIDPVINRLVLGVMTAALFVGSSLLWSMKAPPTIKDVSVVGAAGFLIAIYLSWRLLRAIKKSGDIKSKE